MHLRGISAIQSVTIPDARVQWAAVAGEEQPHTRQEAWAVAEVAVPVEVARDSNHQLRVVQQWPIPDGNRGKMDEEVRMPLQAAKAAAWRVEECHRWSRETSSRQS